MRGFYVVVFVVFILCFAGKEGKFPVATMKVYKGKKHQNILIAGYF